ncbi:hypothetical protein Q3G72_025117 [Acer saccharum]|nr:hypothetical protein Q3G72_025117 [Acer saccharum]
MVVATTRVGGRRRSLHVHHRCRRRRRLTSLAADASMQQDTTVWTTVLSQIYLVVESLFLPHRFSVPISSLFHRDIVIPASLEVDVGGGPAFSGNPAHPPVESAVRNDRISDDIDAAVDADGYLRSKI